MQEFRIEWRADEFQKWNLLGSFNTREQAEEWVKDQPPDGQYRVSNPPKPQIE